MSSPKDIGTCAWSLERLDAYIDDELTADERRALEVHVEKCGDCRSELALAGRIVDGLHSLPDLAAPDHVIDDVIRGFEPAAKAPRSGRFWGWLGERFAQYARHPALAAATLLIVTASVLVLTHMDRWHSGRLLTGGPGESAEVTAQELEMAKVDAMLAFAYLGKACEKTGFYVRDDVIGDRIVAPMHKAIAEATDAASH